MTHANHAQHTPTERNTAPQRILGTTLMNIPGGLLIAGVAPDRAELVAERLARWIPEHARTYDARIDLWTVVAPWDRTARAVALVTTGTILELWDTSYVKGRTRLERATRWAPTGTTGRRAA